MLFFQNFKNYEEFKSLFPMVKHGNEVVSRKNKILLACLKNKTFFHVWQEVKEMYRKNGENLPVDFFNVKSMNGLRFFLENSFLIARHVENIDRSNEYSYCITLMDGGWRLLSKTYKLDYHKGICMDNDTAAIRYINVESNRAFKMKAGKFLCKCLEEFNFTRALPEQAKRWISEEFAREWTTYAESRGNRYTLHTGGHATDFGFIYGSDGFGSCMSRKDQHEFYTNAVDATAAWLEDEDGCLVARCVIFNRVKDERGNIWRLAERQYALDEDDVLKELLVDKLLEADLIDGYKRVGVNCHDNRNFVGKDGESLQNKEFSIDCSLEEGDTLSYQDSFVYYDYKTDTAYNYEPDSYTDMLNDTDPYFERSHDDEVYSEYENCYIPEEDAVYDEYHEDYVRNEDAVTAVFRGREIYLHSDRTDYFCWSERHECYIYDDEAEYVDKYEDYFLTDETVLDYNNEVQLDEDCVYSNTLDVYILEEDAVRSEILHDYFPSDEEREEAELAVSETA